MIRDTSIEAYYELKRSLKLGRDCGIVFDAIVNLKGRFNRWPTDREIQRECNRIDVSKTWEINHITGRRNNLIKSGIVREGSKTQCSITGSRVYTWEIMHPTAELQGAI